MTKIFIVRHGLSKHNIGETDSLDSALTEEGCMQAAAAGKQLRKSISDGHVVIRTSPMLRCLMTTDILVQNLVDERLQASIIVEPAIHESLTHITEDVVIPNRSDLFKYDWRLMPNSISIGNDDGFRLMNRAKAAVKTIESEQTIFVSHGATCIALALAALGQSQMMDWDNSINNGSITYILNGKKVWWGLVPFVGHYVGREKYSEYCKEQ